MKLKNAVVGITVQVKADKWDTLISGNYFEAGDVCIIGGIDREEPRLRLRDLQGNYRGWLATKDVRRLK